MSIISDQIAYQYLPFFCTWHALLNSCISVKYWFLFKKFSALQHLINFELHMARPHIDPGTLLESIYHNNNTALPIIAAFILLVLEKKTFKDLLKFPPFIYRMYICTSLTGLSPWRWNRGRGFSFTFYKFELVLTMIYICTLPTLAVCLSSSVGDYNVKKLMTTDDRLIDTKC